MPAPVAAGALWVGPAEDPCRYEIVERVGGGVEGTTFRAQYLPRPRAAPVTVAVKQFHPLGGASARWPLDGSWARISQQYRLLAGVRQSAHLVDTREAFLGSSSSEPGRVAPFVVMGWVDGRPPAEVLADGSVSLAQRLLWVEQLSQALGVLSSVSAAAGCAVVHGDVKPENCLITPGGDLVLIDLGAATSAEGAARAGLHTPRYAAPEVLAAPHDARTLAADAYSLAATAHWFLTGRAPPPAGAPDIVAALTADLAASELVHRSCRQPVVEHLMVLLDPVASRRAAHDVVRWAAGLRARTQRPVRPARRVAAALGAAAAIVAVSVWGVPALTSTTGMVAAEGADASSGPVALHPADPAYDDENHRIAWDQLPTAPEPALHAEAGYTFPADAATWPSTSPTAVVGARPDGYGVHVTDISAPTVLVAPTSTARSREVVDATATTVSGQGAWGVWCRGSSGVVGDRYDFLVSHAGAVGIFEPDDPGGAPGANGTAYWYLDGIDLSGPVHVRASCFDDGPSVSLSMEVNGKHVLDYRPKRVLGPSLSGVQAYSFSDLPAGAERITAVFADFVQSSA